MSFGLIEKHGDHEEVIFCHNKDVGLKAIIAIHNTALGPALGGTRMWNYKNEEEALVDVLRLSQGMTYKASAAGLNLGGGKAVIIGDPKSNKSEGLFRAFGTYVNSLGGKYITAEDVGTTVKDMEYVFAETPFVTGISESLGGSGDPSPYTAYGVLMSIKASVKKKMGKSDLSGIHVAVQGLGNVGSNLVKFLSDEGAKISVSDIDVERVEQICSTYSNIQSTSVDNIITMACDVLAPCALGAVINDDTVHDLKCSIIAGGANNVLAEYRHGDILREKDILYAPDFVGNSGGLMNVYVELEGYSKERAMKKVEAVYDNIMEVFTIADKENVPTYKAAQILAKRRIEVMSKLRQHHQGCHSRPFSTLRQVRQPK